MDRDKQAKVKMLVDRYEQEVRRLAVKKAEALQGLVEELKKFRIDDLKAKFNSNANGES